MPLIFNITDNYEIFTSIVIPDVSDSWQAVDFCDKFYEIWLRKDAEIMEQHSYEFLSHNFSLRGLICGCLCGGYQTVLDFDYMKATYPKMKIRKFNAISQKDPYIAINPDIIKLINQNEKSMMIMFSIADYTFYFKNVFDTYDGIKDFDLRSGFDLSEEEVPECPVVFQRSTIKADKIKNFNDWIYLKLQSVTKKEECWLFKSKGEKKYYKLLG